MQRFEYKGIRLSVNGTLPQEPKNFEFIKSPTSANFTVSGNGVFNYTEREQVFQNDLFAHHLNRSESSSRPLDAQ